MKVEFNKGDAVEFANNYQGELFHSLIADPPYHLTDVNTTGANNNFGKRSDEQKEMRRQARQKGFMNNEWDGGDLAFQPETWAAFKSLLYDGAFGIAFCGSRGWHRQAVAIEDAGFIIHPTIFLWAYGCLSDDSEILTANGWKHHHEISVGEMVMAYDVEADSYRFAPALDVVYYDYDETAYNIKSDATNQIVSRNHRCLVERGGRFVFELAENLNRFELVPYLENFWYSGCDVSRTETLSEHGLPSLQNADLPSPERHQTANGDYLFDGLPKQSHHDERKGFSEQNLFSDGREKSRLERWLDIQKAKGELRFRQVCSMSDRVSRNGAKGRLRYGTSVGSRSNTQTLSNTDGMRSSQEPQSVGQSPRKSRIVSEQFRTQKARSDGQTRTTLATVKPIHYRGVVWCVKVQTGAFVARRDGKIFVTGNSGFPKATRLDTQLDNAAGLERKVIGQGKAGKTALGQTSGWNKTYSPDSFDISEPQTDDANAWAGHRYGLQALKPAVEPIILFQKPYAKGKPPFQQINDSGAGALNIDGTRIGSETVKTRAKEKGESFSSVGNGATSGGGGFNGCDETERNGRWASNLILAHLPDCTSAQCAAGCPVERIGEQSGESKGSGRVIQREFFNSGSTFRASVGKADAPDSYGDDGTAARFFFQSDFTEEKLENADPVFYCPKASDDERNAGLSRYTGQPRLTMNDGIGAASLKKPFKLRDDLTNQEKEYVFAELKRLGVKF